MLWPTTTFVPAAPPRCDAYATEFDLEAEEYVPLPKGDVHKRKEVVQVRWAVAWVCMSVQVARTRCGAGG